VPQYARGTAGRSAGGGGTAELRENAARFPPHIRYRRHVAMHRCSGRGRGYKRWHNILGYEYVWILQEGQSKYVRIKVLVKQYEEGLFCHLVGNKLTGDVLSFNPI